MSDVEEGIKEMVEQAAGIVAARANKVQIKAAMKLVGFSEEERSKFSLYQRVRRRSLRLEVVEKGKSTTPPSAVEPRTCNILTWSEDSLLAYYSNKLICKMVTGRKL